MIKHMRRNAALYIILGIALSGSALAGTHIPRDSITGREVKESTLAIVPKARAAKKLSNQVYRVVKLSTSVDPQPTVVTVGPFRFETECLENGAIPKITIYLTSENRFDFGGNGEGDVVDSNDRAVVIELAQGDRAAAGFSVWGSTLAGGKIQSFSGFVHVKLNTYETDCTAIFDLIKHV
ncbi:MAG: hypothetical protein M3198_03260 [Actinomycetota bacterium]|nr:hypothetical protein [Actinomycetota bacterium]